MEATVHLQGYEPKALEKQQQEESVCVLEVQSSGVDVRKNV
jgi:hypothetical protein